MQWDTPEFGSGPARSPDKSGKPALPGFGRLAAAGGLGDSGVMKMLILWALVACASTFTLMSADAPGAIRFRSIAKGAFSAIQEPAQLVITNQPAWEALWKKHSAQQSPEKPAPAVDFAKETILFVALGRKNTGGYSISVEELQHKGSNIVVKIVTKSPKPGAITLQALSAPFHVVAAEATGRKFVFEPSEAPEKE